MERTLTNDSNYLRQVREHYEQYPYPPRDPAQEKDSFMYMRACALDCLNYYHYSGKRDFTEGFRALVAGGGTGDATIMLAEQFRGWNAEIIHLDLSTRSLQIAKDRANVRGLDNITWVHGSLLDAQKLFNEKFDLIESCGVLHHLENPDAGLAALAPLLKDDGVMCLMLYARYGREAIYQMQHLMRLLNKDEQDMQQKVENCKKILKTLPSGHAIGGLKDILGDVRTDAGIYDLFLHSHDRAYTVPELYQFMAGSGLTPTHFFFENQPQGNDLYRLEAYFADGSLSDAISRLNIQEKQAAAELMNGKMFKHVFYATKNKTALPSLDDLENVPFFDMTIKNKNYHNLRKFLSGAKVGETYKINSSYQEVPYINTPNLARICNHMDGNKSLGEIFNATMKSYSATDGKPSMEVLKAEFKVFFTSFSKQDLMFLRHKSVPQTARIEDIQAHMA